MSISVLIADDHDIIRAGIKNILRGQSDYEAVAEAKDGEEGLKQGLLTEREQDVLRLATEGKTAYEIARILYISQSTVETHKKDISKKLGLHETSNLIKYAIKHKLVDIEEY